MISRDVTQTWKYLRNDFLKFGLPYYCVLILTLGLISKPKISCLPRSIFPSSKNDENLSLIIFSLGNTLKSKYALQTGHLQSQSHQNFPSCPERGRRRRTRPRPTRPSTFDGLIYSLWSTWLDNDKQTSYLKILLSNTNPSLWRLTS